MSSCTFSFGVVPVGTTAVKSHILSNYTGTKQTYIITRNKQTNPIYYVFDVSKYEVTVHPGQEFKLDVSYSPNISGSKNFDSFKIYNKGNNYTLSVMGECIGPEVEVSMTNFNFYRTRRQTVNRQAFTLMNKSKVPAIFQFDCTEEGGCTFKVRPVRGTIKARSQVFVTMKFIPSAQRVYFKQLCCLILHHEPILLNCLGYYIDQGIEFQYFTFKRYPFELEETVSFSGYLSDSVNFKHVPPPVSLTDNSLDFGAAQPRGSCQILVTSFTNHMDNEVELTWEKVKLFSIYPEKLKIPPRQSALFECKFIPTELCCLSSAIVDGYVTWVTPKESPLVVNVPIPVTLRFIGHTFPKTESWIASVSVVPNTVILPLSIPTYPCWTTFMIQSHTHLPVMFKLLPPRKTNFVMKPRVGVIREYQIVTVQLETTSTEITSYIETWNIELNGQADVLLPLYVKGQIDKPNVVVGTKNFVEFEPIQPGAQGHVLVPMTNISSCYLEYNFILSLGFEIDEDRGELAPNEEIILNCFYQADLNSEGEKTFQVVCQLQNLYKETIPIGEKYDVVVKVKVNIVYAELCGMPHSYECGQVEYETKLKFAFYLYNFGCAKICYKLVHDDPVGIVNMFPENSVCGPKQKTLVSVEFTIRRLGKQVLTIGYTNRASSRATRTILGGPHIDIFKVMYDCVYPNLQILDLTANNLGGLFTKGDLWRMFAVDEINAALEEVVSGEIRRVKLSLPSCQIADKEFFAMFVIKNVSNFGTNFDLKRLRNCDCKRKEVTEGLSKRQMIYDCPHRNLFKMTKPDVSIEAQTMQHLTCNINYLFKYDEFMSYCIELAHNRSVILNASIPTVLLEFPTLSCLGGEYIMNLGYIYIGLREAPVQAWWLYNNTDFPIPYELDELEIVKLCNKEGFPVLTCLNNLGFVKPRSIAPLLFKFLPIEKKTYQVIEQDQLYELDLMYNDKVVVPLVLGKEVGQLEIIGHGTDKICQTDLDNYMSLPSRPVENDSLIMSVDRIITEPFLALSSTERLIFIKNQSRNRIKYTFVSDNVSGLIRIEVMETEGVLEPLESHSVVVTVISLNEPCRMTVHVVCEFIDYTQLTQCQETKKLLSERKREVSDSDDNSFEEIEEVPVPEPLHIVLPITVNVIGVLDSDSCVSPEDQMKQKPFDRIQLNAKQFVKNYYGLSLVKNNSKTIESTQQPIIHHAAIQNVMEDLAGGAVFSSYFSEILTVLQNEPSPFYNQIQVFGDAERWLETEKFLTQPKPTELTDICKATVIDTLQQVQQGPKTQDETSQT